MPETTDHPAFDAKGRLLALTEEEERLRRGKILRAMDEMFLMGDAEEQAATFDALVKGIDGVRPADRRKFEE